VSALAASLWALAITTGVVLTVGRAVLPGLLLRLFLLLLPRGDVRRAEYIGELQAMPLEER
jgi:hypothetical protein